MHAHQAESPGLRVGPTAMAPPCKVIVVMQRGLQVNKIFEDSPCSAQASLFSQLVLPQLLRSAASARAERCRGVAAFA